VPAANSLDKLARVFRNSLDMKSRIPPVLIIFALVCFALVQKTQAVSPPPDGGYPGGNTAEGQNALLSLTSGAWNTAVGFASLKSNTIGNLNTAIGVNALSLNTTGINNTANGGNALYRNTTGHENTANGVYALFGNTTGTTNTAMGTNALRDNTTGVSNTATGDGALARITGNFNTANGYCALLGNTSVTGSGNTAIGACALIHGGGTLNTALGYFAGTSVSGVNNIDIGANVYGEENDNNTIRIGNPDITDTFISGISGTTVASGASVFVDSNGHLGTVTSSKRFKDNIKPMDKASEAIFLLEPVTFRYKKEIDPAGTSQFGLVAEEVEQVNPELVARDGKGKPYTVRYEAVNAMLLNEFLKEHRKNEEQGATIARQQEQIDALAAGLQKVSAQLEASKPASQVVNNP